MTTKYRLCHRHSLLLGVIVLFDEVFCKWEDLLHGAWHAVGTLGPVGLWPHVRANTLVSITAGLFELTGGREGGRTEGGGRGEGGTYCYLHRPIQ